MSKTNIILLTLLLIFFIIGVATISYSLGTRCSEDKSLFSGKNNWGETKKEARKIGNVTEIELNGCGNIALSQGNTSSLVVEAKANMLPHIKTNVSGDKLVIDYDRDNMKEICSGISGSKINYKIVVKDLNKFTIDGSGKVVADSFSTENIELRIEGSGDIYIPLSATSIKTVIDGSGNIKLTGITDTQEVAIEGSGNYMAEKLKSQSSTVKIEGSGKIEIDTEEELDITINGSGSVHYHGQPKITQSISGSGKIKSLD